VEGKGNEVDVMQGRVEEGTVVNVTDADFVDVVVEGSKERPVVVDLWAAWCGPCRTLGPMLEKIADERKGAFRLAKLDVDANPYTASQFGVQSIPTVVAFVDGKPVDGFVGAIPEPMINEFVDRLLPTEADRAAEEAAAEEAAGDVADAERRYREALAQDEGNRNARLGLARILADGGDADGARQTLMPLLPDDEADAMLARLEIADWARIQEPGTLASAKRLAAQGKWREALDGMLGALRDDPDARQAMVTVFSAIGEEDDLVTEYRRKLANALF
jgi:putative thioredoxin